MSSNLHWSTTTSLPFTMGLDVSLLLGTNILYTSVRLKQLPFLPAEHQLAPSHSNLQSRERYHSVPSPIFPGDSGHGFRACIQGPASDRAHSGNQ